MPAHVVKLSICFILFFTFDTFQYNPVALPGQPGNSSKFREEIKMKIVDVIKCEGDNRTFIWKYPHEDFNTLSQLIVHQSQEALLFMNGQALDLFGPGRYTLHTKNIPLLNKIINLPMDGESPFHCEVYFINKTEQMAIKWGMGGVNYLDPTNNDYAFIIGASGDMSLRVSDSRKLIVKLVGTEEALSQDKLVDYFRAPITTHIKSSLPELLRSRRISIFEVESNLAELSGALKQKISEEMADYGITLEKFWINTIVKPEKDPVYIELNSQRGKKITQENQGKLDMQRAEYQRQVGLIDHTGEVQKRKMDIDTKRYEQTQLGFTYQQERGFDVMEKIAENEGSGSDLRNAAMGIGMGFGAGGIFGSVISDISSSTLGGGLTTPVAFAPDESEDFGDMPGIIHLKEDEVAPQESPVADTDLASFKRRLEKLAMMKDAGIMADEEFEKWKKQLTDEIMGS